MSKLELLKEADSLENFSKLIGYRPRSVSYILYKIPSASKYKDFSVPKKYGGSRNILAPTKKLKLLQKHLSDLLNDCYEEINNLNEHHKSLSHGFRKHHSIITNASKHRNKRYVFNVDLKDFFPSINFGRVRGFFIKNNHFLLNENIATIIAQIACHNNQLPQGSPCSPIISNLIGHILDIRMVNIAKENKCTYSRYADDLTFSTNRKDFPTQIAVGKKDNKWEVGRTLKKEIEGAGFKLNTKKTSMQYKTSRQVATGLIVNKKINVKKEYYKNARSMCHELFQKDQYYINKDQNIIGSVHQLEGILGFIKRIKDPFDNRPLNKKINYPQGINKLIRQLLFYKYFFALEKPLFICEGKTDIIYLKSALYRLCENYPNLAQLKDHKIEFKINFMNFSKYFRNITLMPEGTSGLYYLIKIYDDYMNVFKGEGKSFPVVILLDNDDGATEIKKMLKKRLKLKTLSATKYYNICHNLFVTFSTEKQGKEIEDLFDENVLKSKVDGKILNRGKEIDDSKEYTKIVFAERIIKENKDDIDFSGFSQIFNKVTRVLEEYSNN